MEKTPTMIKRGVKIRKSLVLLGVIVSFLLVLILPTVVEASSIDEMIPSDNNKEGIYNKYGATNYSFQTLIPERSFWQIGQKASDGIIRVYDHVLSFFFLVLVQITRLFTFLSHQAFTFSFMDQLIDAAEDIIQSVAGVNNGLLGNGLWGSLLGIFASITVLYILFNMLRGRYMDGYQSALGFVMALVICLGFISNAGTIIKSFNGIGNEVGGMMYSMLAKTTGLNTDPNNGVGTISEQVWNELVVRPYTMLQFDDPDVQKKDPQLFNEVLSTAPFSDEREAVLQKALSKYPDIGRERPYEQMLILVCYYAFSIFTLGLFIFWAILSIFYRLKLLIHAAVMAVTLLATLLPGREAGFNSMKQQFIKLIGLCVMTAFVMFFLSLSLVFGHLSFDVVYSAGAGWFTAMIVEAIVVVVIFKYRNEIGQVFSKAAGHIPMPERAKSTVVDTLQRGATRTLYHSTAGKISSMFNRKEHEGVPSTFTPSSLSTAGTNINDATTASMVLRYQREKQAAEQISNESGAEAQYSPFVQKVNENLRNGSKNPFRGLDKEWKEEKNRLSSVKTDGGDMRNAILMQGVNDNMNDQEVASTLYSNENAIREASSFMVNRPKQAINQLDRAKTLNRNRKLETAVDDFVMVQLFQRYKTEYKQAVDTSIETGEPIRHSNFVKKMDGRFKEAGLSNTNKVNTTMLSRKSRIAVATHFQSMPEYGAQKERLLKANDSFRRVAVQNGGISEVPKIQLNPLKNPATIMKNMPPLPTAQFGSRGNKYSAGSFNTTKSVPASILSAPAALAAPVTLPSVPDPKMTTNNVKGKNIATQFNVPMSVTATPVTDPKLTINNVKFSNPDLKNKIEASRANLKNSITTDDLQDMRLEIDTNAKSEVVMNLRNKVTGEVTGGLDDMKASLEIMKKARGQLHRAEVSSANRNIEKTVANKAQSGRKQTRVLKQLE
ncbi:CD3337/EF1877 family mobilome membrane protein [Paenibacillus sp. PDC88]|uniref:CD3337/EF1877 family mobilome membrane protein n=1 Tax=Paenibacillus provencensis TaxID=441151 RepID=A0ABW3QF45_9BACL|nr:hypothetical protein [Paenibacillus sp. PDC88]SDX62860.1 hypothetical protein SAMN05518848_11075 [Paenibacillus sp. PDC88]